MSKGPFLSVLLLEGQNKGDNGVEVRAALEFFVGAVHRSVCHDPLAGRRVLGQDGSRLLHHQVQKIIGVRPGSEPATTHTAMSNRPLGPDTCHAGGVGGESLTLDYL